MTLTINLTSEEEARLQMLARHRGVAPVECVRQLLAPQLPVVDENEAKKNAASIALLESWLLEDATEDPDEIAEAEKELGEFKAAMNAERERAGASRLY